MIDEEKMHENVEISVSKRMRKLSTVISTNTGDQHFPKFMDNKLIVRRIISIFTYGS